MLFVTSREGAPFARFKEFIRSCKDDLGIEVIDPDTTK